MLNCHDATFLLSQRRERRLRLAERMQVRLHISMCGGCRNFGRQVDNLGEAARAFANGEAAPPD